MGVSLLEQLPTDNSGSTQVCPDIESDKNVSFRTSYIQLISTEHRASPIKTSPGSLVDCLASESLLPPRSVTEHEIVQQNAFALK